MTVIVYSRIGEQAAKGHGTREQVRVRPCRLGAGRGKGGSGRVARGTRGRLILDDDRVAVARRKGSAPSFGPGHGHRCVERGAAPGCATTSEGLSATLAKLLPPALVMIAGPQIHLRPSSWRPSPTGGENSAAFVVGAGAAINATVTIAFFASDGASNQQFFTDQVEWTTVETGEKSRGRGAVCDFIVVLHMDPAH